MISDKESINILVSLLLKHGINHAVVCPGSRNAPIVRCLATNGFACISVTDERSAAFQALGISMATNQPVVVCVTSGSALLNLLPGVAEAWHQHRPLIVISADRPLDHINQLHGQTLMQTGALAPWVATTVNLPETIDVDTAKYCNRIVNEAIVKSLNEYGKPVHINVPLREPLFSENAKQLDDQRIITYCNKNDYQLLAKRILDKLASSQKPIIVIGQLHHNKHVDAALKLIDKSYVVLCEPLSSNICQPFDEALVSGLIDDSLQPDFILYAGETTVSRKIVQYLSTCNESWEISTDGEIHDIYNNVGCIIHGNPEKILIELSRLIANTTKSTYAENWSRQLSHTSHLIEMYQPDYSQMLAVKTFEHELSKLADDKFVIHYANSSAVRLACLFSKHYVYVNRGVNGIEGCMSTAVGMAKAQDKPVICVIGDLAFFYDSNCLCNSNCDIRIMLLNNKTGGIFNTVKGMPHDNTTDKFVMASHNIDARGLCESYSTEYVQINSKNNLNHAISMLIDTKHRSRPLLIEVSTDANCDSAQWYNLKEYLQNNKLI